MPREGAATRTVLVDDRADLRHLLSLLLDDEPDFVVVGEAADGRAAIDLTRRTRPDLVVMDHDMPVMTGLEALGELDEGPLVVLFTSDADAVRAQALAAGAAAVIGKDTGVLTLVEQLRCLLAARADPT